MTDRDKARSDDTPPAHDDEVLRLLGKIHDQLERGNRQTRQQDFSLLRLFGALLQMFAIMVAVWGAAGIFEEHSAATARLTLACFLQLASVTAFAIDRFR